MTVRAAIALPLLFVLAPVPAPAADAWLDFQHRDLSRLLVQWSPLVDQLTAQDLDHLVDASFDPDVLVTDWTCPSLKRYASADRHGVPIQGGGVCQTDFPHGNFAHSDVFGAEDNFEAEYNLALKDWRAGDRHTAAHRLGHALHYLEDSAIVLHQECDLLDLVDCLVRHGAHEEQIWQWFQDDAVYCNLRLNACGRLGDANDPVGMAYAFRNYPALLETDDGPSDWADALTLRTHALGWNAKDVSDLPDDVAFWADRSTVGPDWYAAWNWGCLTCVSNLDIAFTELWELARSARVVLDSFARDAGLAVDAAGNDQVQIDYTLLEETANPDPLGGAPDLLARFHIDLKNDGAHDYAGTTVQDVDNAHAVVNHAVASGHRDDSGSGNWLSPVPASRQGTLHLLTELLDDDPLGPQTLAVIHQWWTPSSAPEQCAKQGTRTVCTRVTALGPRWDETAPTTTPAYSGTPGLMGWFVAPGSLALSATDDRSGVAESRWRFAGDAWLAYAESVPLGIEGVTTLDVQSLDAYGNVEAPKAFTVRLDTAPPAPALGVACTRGLEDWCISAAETFPGATDATSGVAEVVRRFNGGTWGQEGLAIPTDGVHVVDVEATDVAGWSQRNAFTVRVDATPPTLRIDRPLPGHSYVADVDLGANPLDSTIRVVGPFTVRATATDATSGMDRVEFFVAGKWCATDSDGANGWSWTWDTECLVGPVPVLQPVPLRLVAYDHAGHDAATTTFLQWAP